MLPPTRFLPLWSLLSQAFLHTLVTAAVKFELKAILSLAQNKLEGDQGSVI